jgi:aryl sulfotransferase
MRVYRNAVMDNARWAGFEPRPDDIFVCTPSKCGTTWMQTIVANLLWPEGDIPGTVVNGISPWIEAKFMPAEAMHAMLRAQTHRRAMKSHSPADAIPWFPQAKYITVGRDGRDAFMSWCNHVQRMKMIDMLNAQAAKEGVRPILKFDGDYHSFFRAWLEEENNFFEVIGSFWARRAEPNLLFVHYNDLKADLGGEMRRVAEFLDIQIPESKWAAVIDRCTFESMRRVEGDADPMQMAFEGGIKGFIFKGTNGRWRDVLTDDELARYRDAVGKFLTDEMAAWLEHGSLASGRRPEAR